MACCALLFVAASARAGNLTDSSHHFTLDVPAGWSNIPQTELASMSRIGGENFIDGARSAQAIPFFVAQAVLGSDPNDPALHVAEFRKGLEESTKSAGAEVLNAAYDATRHAYVADVLMNSPTGRLHALTCCFVGRDESIFVHCYSKDAEYATNKLTFDAIADSFHFDPGHEQVIATVDPDYLLGKKIGMVLGFLIFPVIILACVIGILRKRKTSKAS
jgi:hypothetical protein